MTSWAEPTKSTGPSESSFGGICPRHLGQVSWRFLVDRAGVIDTWTAMLGSRRAFLAMPVAQNRLYGCADQQERVSAYRSLPRVLSASG